MKFSKRLILDIDECFANAREVAKQCKLLTFKTKDASKPLLGLISLVGNLQVEDKDHL